MTLHLRHFSREEADPWFQTWQKTLQSTIGSGIAAVYQKRTAPFWGLGISSLVLSLINGPLVISLGAGLVVYQQLSRLTPQQWQRLMQMLQQRSRLPLSSKGKTLALAGTVLGATYLTTSIWAETHQFWIAVALGSQSLVTLVLLAWLLRTRTKQDGAIAQSRQINPHSLELESLLLELSHPDPLRRLVLVRQLTRLAAQESADQAYIEGAGVSVRSHLVDCFHLMLAQESEPLVRTALKEGLQRLRQPPQLPEGAPPLPSSKEIKQTRRVRRSVVEYIEP